MTQKGDNREKSVVSRGRERKAKSMDIGGGFGDEKSMPMNQPRIFGKAPGDLGRGGSGPERQRRQPNAEGCRAEGRQPRGRPLEVTPLAGLSVHALSCARALSAFWGISPLLRQRGVRRVAAFS